MLPLTKKKDQSNHLKMLIDHHCLGEILMRLVTTLQDLNKYYYDLAFRIKQLLNERIMSSTTNWDKREPY